MSPESAVQTVLGEEEGEPMSRQRRTLLKAGALVGLTLSLPMKQAFATTGDVPLERRLVDVKKIGPLDLELRRLRAHRSEEGRPPLLLIPGAYQGAWAFEDNIGPYFAERGYETFIMSLRGHGASGGAATVDSARFDDYVDDVLTIIGALPRPPILIGHSLGGLLAQRIAKRVSVPGVVLLATPTPRSMRQGAFRLIARFPLAMMKFVLTGNPDHVYRDESVVRGLLFGGAQGPGIDRALARILREPESTQLIADVQSLELQPVDVPVLVVGGDADIGVPVEALHEASERHRGTKKILTGAAHQFFMMPGWEQAADSINAWLQTTAVSELPGVDRLPARERAGLFVDAYSNPTALYKDSLPLNTTPKG